MRGQVFEDGEHRVENVALMCGNDGSCGQILAHDKAQEFMDPKGQRTGYAPGTTL